MVAPRRMRATFGDYLYPALQQILHVHQQAAESPSRLVGRMG